MLQSNRLENDLRDHLNDLLRKVERKLPSGKGEKDGWEEGENGEVEFWGTFSG